MSKKKAKKSVARTALRGVGWVAWKGLSVVGVGFAKKKIQNRGSKHDAAAA